MICVALWNKLMAFIFGTFLRSEIVSQIRGGSRTFKGWGVGGGVTTSAKGASPVGVSGAISIPSILRLISYSFSTNFLLVNFVIVKRKKEKLQKGGEHRPPSPPPLNPPLQIHEHLQQFMTPRIWVALHIMSFFLSVFGFGIQPYLFCSQRRMFLLIRVRKMKTSSNDFFWKEIIKWPKTFQVLLDPFVETSILFRIL